MKLTVLVATILGASLLIAWSQELVLNAGQSVTWTFKHVPPLLVASGPPGADFEVIPYVLGSRWESSFQIEVFETNSGDTPRYMVTVPGSPGAPLMSGPEYSVQCGGTNLWQDLQGAVRLTVLSGSIRFEHPGIEIMTSASGYNLYGLQLEGEQPNAVERFLPCAGPAAGRTWADHGQFVAAVVEAADLILAQGLISERDREAVIAQAARSDCGKN